MRTQKIIANKAGAKKSFVTKNDKSAPRPIRNTRQSSHSNAPVTPGTSKDGADDMNSLNNKQEVENVGAEVEGDRLPGELLVTEHGLKKFKRVCKFKCKECEIVCNSRHDINHHHKEMHSKCYCNKCGKACNTPSTLARHMYSHKEDLPYPCDDCVTGCFCL